MGQAKLRGNRDQRIAQVAVWAESRKKEVAETKTAIQRARNEIPKVGTYVSAINSKIQFIVEDVWTLEPDDEEYIEGFFLAQVIEANGAVDMGAMGYEFDQHEWRSCVEEYQLFLQMART